MITVYENIIPPINFKNLYTDLKNTQGWSFTGFSASSTENNSNFWYLNLLDNKFFTEQIFKNICKITGKKFKILRCYANGQTSDQSGSFHIDSWDKDSYTFLYYINPEWNVLYGGATVFCETTEKNVNNFELGNTSKYSHNIFYPKPNTGILFCSNIYHVGLSPTKEFKGLRITVAYKLKKMRD